MANKMSVQNVNMSPGHKSATSTSHRVLKVGNTGTVTAPGKTGASNMGKGKHGQCDGCSMSSGMLKSPESLK